MAFTTPPTVTNDVNNITAAEMNQFVRDNIAAIRERPTVKVASPSQSVADSTAATVDFGGLGNVEEWDTDTIHSPVDEWFDLAATQSGLWYSGATARFSQGSIGDRRWQLDTANSGSTTTNIAQWRARTSAERAVRMTAGTVFNMAGSDADIETQVFHTQTANLSVTGEMWSLFYGDLTSQTGGLSNMALTESQGTSAWWNQYRSNVLRVWRRPAVRSRFGSNGTLANGVWTKLTFDTEVYDNASLMGADESKFTVPSGLAGEWELHGCLVVDTFTGSGDRIILQFAVNGTRTGPSATGTNVAAGNGAVPIEAILTLNEGDEVELYAFQDSGAAKSLPSGSISHLGGVLVSGRVTAPNRQFFTEGLPDTNWDFTAPDSSFMPRGLVNLMARDYLAHLWNPPVLGVSSFDQSESVSAGGWQPAQLRDTYFDNWGLFDSDLGVDGGIRLPAPGVWKVWGYGALVADGVGGVGDRGLRVRHNSSAEAPIRLDAQTASGHDFSKTLTCLVNADAGDVVRLEALQTSGDELPFVGSLVAAWMRDKVA